MIHPNLKILLFLNPNFFFKEKIILLIQIYNRCINPRNKLLKTISNSDVGSKKPALIPDIGIPKHSSRIYDFIYKESKK